MAQPVSAAAQPVERQPVLESVQPRYRAAQHLASLPGAPFGGGQAVLPGDEIEVRYFRNTELQGERYGINVGDQLRVDVVDHPELSRENVLVLPDGQISLPLAGSFRAAGNDVDSLSAALAAAYDRKGILQPDVQVAVISSDRRLDNLLGIQGDGGLGSMRAVVSEGGVLTLPFLPPLSASQPIADLVQQIRTGYRDKFGGSLEVTANLVARGTQPLVYVMGEVLRPSAVEYDSALNPMMAVAAAGGFLITAEPEDVQVVRQGADGSVNLWAFDVKAGLEGSSSEAANFKLQPRDVVFVRRSGIAEANRWIDQNIRQMLPFDVSTGFSYSPFND
jgi:polysaccharide export outer membrane protein